MLDIFVDGDACPVKDEILRLALSHSLRLYMVSNQGLRLPPNPLIQAIVVGREFDAADNWIADHITEDDIAITSDIQLAARCLKKAAHVVGPTGHIFTLENIGSALAMRELNSYLRQSGENTSANRSFSKKDRSHFLQSMDKIFQKLKRREMR